jgi:hypothetical protein
MSTTTSLVGLDCRLDALALNVSQRWHPIQPIVSDGVRSRCGDARPIPELGRLRSTRFGFGGPEKCREQIPCDGGDDEVGADFESPVRDNVRRLCCRADRAPGAAPTVFCFRS